MRIERHRDGDAATLFSAATHALDNLQMSAVHTVEIAQSQHGLVPAWRPLIVGKVNDVHVFTRGGPSPRSDSRRLRGPIVPRRSRICYAMSISNARPSYANSTPAGSRAHVA